MSIPLPRYAHLAALALCCATFCHWLIRLSLPSARVVTGTPAAAPDRPVHAAELLGDPAAAVAGSRFHLLGIARLGDGAAAVISCDDAPARALGLGATVAPGIQIQAIDADSVRLGQGQRVIRLSLPRADAATAIILR